MNSTIKIATLNLCLGLKNKKEIVKKLILDNGIDILCLQETEIEPSFPVNLLTFRGYSYESENNSYKSRCGIYVSDKISYVRKTEIEPANNHLVVIDLNDKHNTRIINIYRPFNPKNLNQKHFFDAQLEFIKLNCNSNTIIMGDFNLDHSKKHDINYSHKHYFSSLNDTFEPLNLHQIVTFNTWSRVINNLVCNSILDHIYLKDVTRITNLSSLTPQFGDHLLISFEIVSSKTNIPKIYKRNWRTYSKEILIDNLLEVDWDLDFDDVQSTWNCFESKLTEVVDKIAPFELEKDLKKNKIHLPAKIKTKINKRARLLKNCNKNPTTTPVIKQKIKDLNKEIKTFFNEAKTKNVRNCIKPGNSKTLWDAVNKAKDCNINSIPETLFLNDQKISDPDRASTFANFFSDKVKLITNTASINNNVYNGRKLLNAQSSPFMTSDNILACLKDIKVKNCEGYDRIPQRILADGAEILVKPLTSLFERIYNQNKIPDQWSIAKVIPLHKKGPKNKIENYRPIANLCSSTKIFEKLILKRLLELNTLHNIDLTGKHQHGFKRNKSTSTLSLQLQSLIARALDEDNYVIMASLDLSAAFDVVNIDLLLKRLRLIGLPDDVVGLIEIWLKNRYFYVQVLDHNSNFIEINSGTIQGSILGPILYAIFVAPLYDISKISNFADDNFAITQNKNKISCILAMEAKLNEIVKWLKDSGLKVNESKTEICLFHRKDTPQVVISVSGVNVKSKDHINVLGIIFDSKLTWAKHIAIQTNKANSALHAIKLIRRYFNQSELLSLLTSNFYSILFYNSEVWHIPSLKPELKQILLSASARALKVSQRAPDRFESFINIHTACKRALPNQLIIYKHSILLHKIYNSQSPKMDWIDLNFNQTFNTRQIYFRTTKSNNHIIGNNILNTRLTVLNSKIPLIDLNLSLDSFKVKYKSILLSA